MTERERVGRLIMDTQVFAADSPNAVDIEDAINEHTKFTAERQTGMRIDVFKDATEDQ